MIRSATGSPQPGQSECSLRSSRSGFAKTFSSSLMPPSRRRAPRSAPSTCSTSSSGPTPKPEWSWLMPPIACTGTRPRTASSTSSIIWPAFSSNTATARARDAASATTARREGPERDRPHEADAQAALAREPRRVASESRREAEGDDDEVGVVEPCGLGAHLLGLDAPRASRRRRRDARRGSTRASRAP